MSDLLKELREEVRQAKKHRCVYEEVMYLIDFIERAADEIERPHGGSIKMTDLGKLAQDADNWADSYEGQRQERWLRGFAKAMRDADAEIKRLHEIEIYYNKMRNL